MARYIDAEQFRGKHEVAEVNGKLNSVILYADIVEAPTADVVPRAEVEKIFAEIEGRISSMEYRANTPRKTVKVEELKEQVDWVLHEVVPDTIAELKKKYIGDKT